MSSICGGVISQTMERKAMKKYGIWATAMSYVLPDEQYKKYIALIKARKDKEANKMFERYAHSAIG